MRAKEFTINIPINIKINGEGEPQVSTDTQEPVDYNVGTFIPPLQQKIELLKKSAGVKSEFDPMDGQTTNAENNTVATQVASDDEPLE
jgi:hypothetical protein